MATLKITLLILLSLGSINCLAQLDYMKEFKDKETESPDSIEKIIHNSKWKVYYEIDYLVDKKKINNQSDVIYEFTKDSVFIRSKDTLITHRYEVHDWQVIDARQDIDIYIGLNPISNDYFRFTKVKDKYIVFTIIHIHVVKKRVKYKYLKRILAIRIHDK